MKVGLLKVGLLKGGPLRSVLPMVLILNLAACSRPDDARVQQLEARVTSLEAQIGAMRKAAEQARVAGAPGSDSQQATARAAAQYCATQLASSLEEYRQDNARYPAMSAVALPSACQGFRVAWERLEKAHYQFSVSGQAGAVLASEVR
ncbi:hypothetical protein [Deinococcus sp.]|uniref:hypothetical protein n=1 Tax=Deinococcus sp. TaxID=47478 RepID=UPI003C7B8154